MDALRLLAKQGRVTHSGTRWAFASFDAPTPPQWHFPWTPHMARRSVRMFHHGRSDKRGWHPAGKFATGPAPLRSEIKTIEAAVRVSCDEARSWCQLYGAEWVTAYDKGDAR